MASTYPVRVTGRLDPGLSRWMWLVKWFLAIPHYLVLAVLGLAFAVVTVIAFFAILFTGRYPRSLFEFNVGVMRWSWRVSYYALAVLGTDRYPPFTLADVPDYPARLEVDYPERLSRLLVLVKWWLLAIPHYLIVGLLAGGGTWAARQTDNGNWAWRYPNNGLIGILALVAVIVLAISGRYPRGLFDLLLGLNRWVLRVTGYAALMTDKYPPFRLDMGGDDPVGTPGPVAPVGPSAAGSSTAPGDPGAPVGARPAVPPSGFSPTGSATNYPAGAASGYPAEPVPPAGRGGLSAGSVAAIIIGSLLVLAGLGLLGGGAVVGWVNSQRDRDGYLSTGTERFATPTAALTTERFDISIGGPGDWLYNEDRFGRVRISVASATGAPVFVGVAPQADVDRYLGSVAHDQISNISLRPFRVDYQRFPGAAQPAGDPVAQPWTAAAAGPGAQTLSWRMTEGQWAVVVANADGRPGVDVQLRAAAQVPGLRGIAIGLLVAGLVAIALGIALILAGARRPAPARPPMAAASD